jgi:hypothetical protein
MFWSRNEVDKVCVVKTRKQSTGENTWTPWNNGYSRTELQSIQKDNPDIGPIFRWKECGSRPDRVELVKDSPTTRHYWYLWDSLEITDELLFKKFHRKDGVESYNQFIVPFRLRKEILFPAYLMALPQAYFLVVLYWTCVEVYSPHIFHTDLSKY